MLFSDSSRKDCQYTGISTGAYIVFYQGGPINHNKHVPGPVYQSSAKSEYNIAHTARVALAHLMMLNNELTNKDPYVIPYQALLIIFDSKSAVCMAKNGKDTKQTRHISRRMNLGRNGEECNLHKKFWCEGGL